jgi:hypothetical protein
MSGTLGTLEPGTRAEHLTLQHSPHYPSSPSFFTLSPHWGTWVWRGKSLSYFPSFIHFCVTFCQSEKIPDGNNFRKEGFILAHTFRYFSPSFSPSWGCSLWSRAVQLMVARKQSEGRKGSGKDTPFSDTLQ